MISFTEGQKKAIASGLTVLSLLITLSFVALIGWCALKTLAFASAAIVPVILGFFLSLFFKPYFRWWKGVLRNPTLALIAMLATVFIPLGLILWYAGAVMVDQISNLIAQGPHLVRQVMDWFAATFPKLHALLGQMGVPYENLGDFYTKYGATALKAGSGALKCLSGVVSVLVTLIFFVFFLTTKDRRGGEIVSQMPFLKDGTRDFLAAQIDAFVEILVSFFQRQTVICLVEGVMYGVGFWIVGLPYGFLIGFTPKSEGHAYLSEAETSIPMPYISDLSDYRTYAQELNSSSDGSGASAKLEYYPYNPATGKIDTNSKRTINVSNYTVDDNTDTKWENEMVQSADVGPSGIQGAGDQGALVLVGTKDHPIKIDGPVIIASDVIIMGYITGQGTIYSGRNVHIVGDLTYRDPPTWKHPDDTPETTRLQNQGKDLVALMAKGCVVVGDYTDADWQSEIEPYINASGTSGQGTNIAKSYYCDENDTSIGYPGGNVDSFNNPDA